MFGHDRPGFESFAAPGSLAAAAIRFALAWFRPFDDAPTDVDPPCEAKARPIAAASVSSTRSRRRSVGVETRAQGAIRPGLRAARSNRASAAPL
jgi:hypothetical protein